jgi:hypothetical protein
MKKAWIFTVLLSVLSFAESSPSAKHDKTIKDVNAAIQSHEVSSGQCKRLGADIETLSELYEEGDKSVLPTLFRVTSSGKSVSCEHYAVLRDVSGFLLGNALSHGNRTAAVDQSQSKRQTNVASAFGYLREFYRKALLNDPVGFVTAMGKLPDQDQKVIAFAIAGGTFGLHKEAYDAIDAALKGIPDSESTKATSQACLETLERVNAPFAETYFPPKTFTSADAEFQIRWFTLSMYRLGEKPLWPASGEAPTTYRLTYIPSGMIQLPYGPVSTPAFSGPTAITFSLLPDGSARVAIRTSYFSRDGSSSEVDETRSATDNQLQQFFAQLEKANFWTTPTELPRTNVQGADWVMEGVKDGKYRTVARRCPDLERQSAEEDQFAKAGRLLFEMAGHKWAGTFDLHCTSSRPYFSQNPNEFAPSCPGCLREPGQH